MGKIIGALVVFIGFICPVNGNNGVEALNSVSDALHFGVIGYYNVLAGDSRVTDDAVFRGYVVATDDNAIFGDTVRGGAVTGDTIVMVDEVVSHGFALSSARGFVPSAMISRDMLNMTSPAAFVTPMNKIPGVFIQSGSVSTNRITIRGTGSRTLYGTNKIRAYYMGFPITEGGGEVSIDSYDPESLNHIEVIKGPKATDYGANLGGVILLDPLLPDSGEVYLHNSATVGSFGLLKNALSAGYGGSELSLRLSYDHMQLNGFRENSGYRRNGLLATAGYVARPGQEFSLLVNRTTYLAFIPGSLGKTDFEENPSLAAERWREARGHENNKRTLIGIKSSFLLSDAFTNTTGLFFSHTDNYEPRPFNILDAQTTGFGARTVFHRTFSLSADTEAKMTFGAEWFSDVYQRKTFENLYAQNNGQGSLRGAMLSDDKEIRNTWNIFVSGVYPLSERLKVQAGFNLNSTEYDYRDRFYTGEENKSSLKRFDPVFAPNISVVYNIDPSKTLYANVSRGHNFPSMEETLGVDGHINPDINPEKGWNHEAGSRLYLAQARLRLDISAYIMTVKDLLVPQRMDNDIYVGRNAGRTLHRGLEAEVAYSFDVGSELLIHPFVGMEINFHKFKDYSDDENDYSGNDLTGVPDRRFNAGVEATHQCGLSVYAVYRYVGIMPLNDANTLYSDSYGLIDFKAAYTTAIGKHLTVEAGAGIDNFADTKHSSSVLINALEEDNGEPRYFYPGPPRNFYGNLRIKYAF